MIDAIDPRWRTQLDVAMAIAGLCLVGVLLIKASEHARDADKARIAQVKELRGVCVSLEDQLDAERRELDELRDELAARQDLLDGALGRLARADKPGCPMNDPYCDRCQPAAGAPEQAT